MADPQIRTVTTPAMAQQLVEIQFSTATWLVILASLRGLPGTETHTRIKTWAAEHIVRELLVATGYAIDDDDPTRE